MLPLTLVLMAAVLSRSQAETQVGGVLLQDTTWTGSETSNPYYVVNDVHIPRNVTLTIRAGVQVIFVRSDLEILVKGNLQINGTSAKPVHFYNGSDKDSKFMITFQSTNLSKSIINHAVFTGPKRALQLTNVPVGLLQNTGVLVVQNTAFRAGTTIATNGSYPVQNYYPYLPPRPTSSLQLFSTVVNDSTIITNNSISDPITVTNSQLFNVTVQPLAAFDGIQFVHSKLKTLIITFGNNYNSRYQDILSFLGFNDCTIDNADEKITRSFDPAYLPYIRINFHQSTIQNSVFQYASSTNWYATQLFNITNSRLRNVSINILTASYYCGYSVCNDIFISNSTFDTSTLQFIGAILPTNVQNSFFSNTNVTITSVYPYMRSNVTIKNVVFENGIMALPVTNVIISYSKISLKSIPLTLGDSSSIFCSSITRIRSVPQSNTTGVQASTIYIMQSSISNFDIGLDITSAATGPSSISNSNLLSNYKYNIRNLSPYAVNANNNWWGTSNKEIIKNKIYDYWNDIHYGEVIYSNYSTIKLSADDGCRTP